jgi:carbon-monoxide dehydrogenase medium subunit
MSAPSPEWLQPASLQEALELRAEYGEEALVVAGGSFLGILMNQGFLMPEKLLALRGIPGLDRVEANGELHLGAMATHRRVEMDPGIQRGWPALCRAFSLVASPRVRHQATVGGVLADADYASDPPAMFAALGARVVAKSLSGEREIPVEEFILGHYTTSLREDELVTGVRVLPLDGPAVYRKFRSRSSEDRPCVSVAAALSGGSLRIFVGAVSDSPQYFPQACALADGRLNRELAAEIGRRYGEKIEPISDSRGSGDYRRRVIAVEVRRALEELCGE